MSGECTFRYDDERADVTVTTAAAPLVPSATSRHADVPTLTCTACGLRLAHVGAPNGRVTAAYGIGLDAMVRTGRALPKCTGKSGVSA